MSGIQFGFDGTKSTSTVISRLAGDAIHDVTFKGVEATTVENKTSGDKYNILRLKFEGEGGAIFEDSIFEPKKGDEVRKDNNYGYQNPSNVDELMFKVRHLIAAVAPKVDKTIEEKGGKLQIGTWDQLTAFLTKHLTPVVGASTQIKLFKKADKNGKESAVFPSFVLGFTKAGDLYPKTNFIGANLAFTAKEVEKIKNATTAKPTAMPSTDGLDLAPKASSDALNLDIDLL